MSVDDASGRNINFESREAPMLSITRTSKLKGKIVGVVSDSTPPEIRLQVASGSAVKCEVTEDMARALARLDGHMVELVGAGTWSRDGKGRWKLAELVVGHFSKLQDVSVTETINRLRRLPGNRWKDEADLGAALSELRG